MDALQRVFQSLSRTERRYLKNYLTAFHSRGKNRAIELVDLMEAEPELTIADLAERLYGDRKSKAFIMLKARVLDKMLETLILSVNFQNNPAYQEDPSIFEHIEVRKELIYATMLLGRGLEEVAMEVIKKAIERAQRLGMSDLELHGYVLLRTISQSPDEVRNVLNPAVSRALEAYRSDLMGVGMMDAFRIEQREQQGFNEVLDQFLIDNIPALEDRLEAHFSPRGKYYALYLKVMLFEGREDYARAKATLAELIDLFNTHKGISSRNRLGVPYTQLATIEVITGDYVAARKSAEHGQACFPPQKSNFVKASIPLILACIYGGDLAAAAAAIERLAPFKQRERLRTTMAWIRYLDSCISFCRDDLASANEALGDLTTLFSNKEIWNTGLRIHEIQILISRDLLDLAAARIEALRKHLQRHQVKPRAEQICRYLICLERQSFHFDNPSDEMLALEETLAGKSWSAVWPEVIRFDVWVRSRREGRAFYPVFLEALNS